MESVTNESTKEMTFSNLLTVLTIPLALKMYISNQSKKRQLFESEILSECIQYHQENAGTQ